jgi:hypothetical protein
MRYVALLLLLSSTALARDNGQWNESPINVREWFQSLMQPDNPYMSCCGEADAFEADTFEVDGDHYVAGYYRWQRRDSRRHANHGAEPENEVGPGQPDRSRYHLHRQPGTGLLLRRSRRRLSNVVPLPLGDLWAVWRFLAGENTRPIAECFLRHVNLPSRP